MQDVLRPGNRQSLPPVLAPPRLLLLPALSTPLRVVSHGKPKPTSTRPYPIPPATSTSLAHSAQSSTCVPNAHPFLPILAPIRNPDICPHWSERWDLRTKGLGCHVSTVTFLTCIISIVSTLLVLGLGWASFKLGKFCWGRWKRRERGWQWEKWRWFWGWRLLLRKKSGGCGNGDERAGQEADERTGLMGG